LAVMPKPSGVEEQEGGLLITYAFEKRNLNGKQILKIGLIKKSIETLLGNHISWVGESVADNGPIYSVNRFYHKYSRYREWPKWIWPKHRQDLMQCGMRYAQRLYEKDLFCFEMVLGAMYLMNQRMPSRISDYKILEEKALWVKAKTHERILRGDFERLSGEALSQVRTAAGKVGNKKSQQSRQSKAALRRQEIQKLMDEGITDPHAIASRTGVNISTVYRDIKAMRNTHDTCSSLQIE